MPITCRHDIRPCASAIPKTHVTSREPNVVAPRSHRAWYKPIEKTYAGNSRAYSAYCSSNALSTRHLNTLQARFPNFAERYLTVTLRVTVLHRLLYAWQSGWRTQSQLARTNARC